MTLCTNNRNTCLGAAEKLNTVSSTDAKLLRLAKSHHKNKHHDEKE